MIELIADLKMISPFVIKLGGFVWKHLPRNRPCQKAIRTTSEKYSTRLPDLAIALENWLESDTFKAEVEKFQDGAQHATEIDHVELFVRLLVLATAYYQLKASKRVLVSFILKTAVAKWVEV